MHLRTQINVGMLMVTIWLQMKSQWTGNTWNSSSPPPQWSMSHLKRLFWTSGQKHTPHTATDNDVSSHYWKLFSLHKIPYIARTTFTTFLWILLATLSLATSKLLLHWGLVPSGIGSLKLTATTNLLFRLLDKWHNQYPNNWSVTSLIRVFSL